MVKERKEAVINVTFQLKGETAQEFLEYKASQFIDADAVAAKKLTLERLSQIKKEKAEPVTA